MDLIIYVWPHLSPSLWYKIYIGSPVPDMQHGYLAYPTDDNDLISILAASFPMIWDDN